MTVFLPGDVVASAEIKHLWFVHGHPDIELLLTNPAGLCVSIPDAEQRYGRLFLHCRPSGHPPMAPLRQEAQR
ncbi:hypothetical protein OG884_20150 [Streptosporangium sp. NBC_01755]|uniref:hypothetical protein n=1 Tax=unclassified Streptosporangium TaxID=2632669 RepID=UPI002DD94746|nr:MULTISPECIES: hypothetical protein [unclassified Streptosporangium]WSA24707.1 hypothetical protein OIE13_27760 [Streptosporangium sp. NBC_01810]WSC97216.1 hypothetical protein OG884_20150 [Streptosporangium sp. NBC_01755]